METDILETGMWRTWKQGPINTSCLVMSPLIGGEYCPSSLQVLLPLATKVQTCNIETTVEEQKRNCL